MNRWSAGNIFHTKKKGLRGRRKKINDTKKRRSEAEWEAPERNLP